MEYLKTQDLVVMDLVDLEHCGFDHDVFDFELRADGIEEPKARRPVALLVNFTGGHIVTPGTTVRTINARKKAQVLFRRLLSRLGEEMTVEVEVRGGVADITTKSAGVRVVIRDYDSHDAQKDHIEEELEAELNITNGKRS